MLCTMLLHIRLLGHTLSRTRKYEVLQSLQHPSGTVRVIALHPRGFVLPLNVEKRWVFNPSLR